ncbi:J domain-containing protein [bacterium C-53]|nr:J domain-containing protein [Lachnospiraceae bacterium]NBI03392.1 J domain-containing protein [Lachnospiraceae bacterium]RKJ09638.1 J domain-containing protein [bacterium C-53]
MNVECAKKILGISPEDDRISVKKKYRRLIGMYHPDAVGSDRPEQIRRAQEINEAYHCLKKHANLDVSEKSSKSWRGEVNERAFCERNIYLYYSMDIPENHPYYRTACGKYMWDPDEEEFELFLASIHHASKELLEKTEEKRYGSRFDDFLAEEIRFEFQVRLFQYLAMQYMNPVKTLHKLVEPVKTDKQGREIYRFRAFLGSRRNDAAWNAVIVLKKGDSIYPKSFEGNKIAVMDGEARPLGYLSLEEDPFYFCIIPLLKKKLAQIKMAVKEVEIRRNIRPHRVKADIDFYFRLEDGAQGYEDGSLNLKIADLLKRYEEQIMAGNV